ncbi:MAG TPA: hypothetical protein VM076_08895 [Gemmatimonadaceae bacterium]|nr:hypothetical protein [Gemmatimonadaceae bacterium]
MRRSLRALAIGAIAIVCSAHIGTFDVFYAGKAGPYDVQVTVRPPGVIPGLAQITVRVNGDGVRRVTAQASQWNLGTRGAPPPDEATPVAGAPGLYATQLWLMTSASYAVNVAVEGSAGSGRAVIPVNAVATKRLPMIPGLGWTLAGLGIFLTVGALTIVRAAAAESTLAPGQEPDARRTWRGRSAAAVGGVVIGALLLGGWNWWNGVDGNYARRIYRPLQTSAVVRATDSTRTLRLSIDDARWQRRESSPLVPDHGKIVHLFLVRSPAMDAFAHLHPALIDSATFDAALGTTPAGRYRFYADVVHETGFAETLAGEVDVPAPGPRSQPGDPDDGILAAPAATGDSARLADGATIVWHRPRELAARVDAPLRFSVVDADGKVAELEPYLGMTAHALVSRDDGRVFVHLHSSGSFAMASQHVLEAVQRGDTLPSIRAGASPRAVIRGTDMPAMGAHDALRWRGDSVSFPFAFPSPGSYRLWVQVKRGGVVQTGAFDATVTGPAPK